MGIVNFADNYLPGEATAVRKPELDVRVGRVCEGYKDTARVTRCLLAARRLQPPCQKDMSPLIREAHSELCLSIEAHGASAI